jgi:hypothetical protein
VRAMVRALIGCIRIEEIEGCSMASQTRHLKTVVLLTPASLGQPIRGLTGCVVG